MAGTPPTSTAFLAEYPEFTSAGTTLIDAKLLNATYEISEEVWGDQWTRGVMLAAADMLARSPTSRQTPIGSRDGSTLYSKKLDELRRAVTTLDGVFWV